MWFARSPHRRQQDSELHARLPLLIPGAAVASGWLVWLHVRKLRRAVHMAQRQATALARTLNALTGEPELDTFLGQVLTAIAEQLDSDWATLWLHDQADDLLAVHLIYERGRVRAATQAGAAAPEPLPAASTPIWQEMTWTRRPILISDVASDRRLVYRMALSAQGVRTLLTVPLVLGEETIGWFSIRSTEHRRYRPEEIELARALAQQATLAVQLARLAEHRRQAAVLEERNRLAREIHDTLAQGFTGIVVQLEAAEDVLAEAPESAREHLSRARTLARESLSEARRSVWALRPEALERTGLAEALERIALQLTTGTPTRIEVHASGTPLPLAAEVESELLRIGQEAIANAVKHAQASAIHVDVAFDPRFVRVRVKDNGRGFEEQAAGSKGDLAERGFGLIGMRERAERAGAQLTVESRPGIGTEVVVLAPARNG